MKKLIAQLSYQFKDAALLTQALTRTSAIHERVSGAAQRDYQSLELVGDAVLKSTLSALILQDNPSLKESELHDTLQPLIRNDGCILKIADKLKIDAFLIRGNSEAVVTNNMRADAVEAILGAVHLDSIAHSKAQKGVILLIQRLWGSYLPAKQKVIRIPVQATPSIQIATTTVSTSDVSTASSAPEKATTTTPSLPTPPSPPTQRMFSNISTTVSPEKYAQDLTDVSNINRKKNGKVGDTALMAIMRKKTLRPTNEIPKAQALIKLGALWTAANNKGETAESLAGNHNAEVIASVRSCKPN
jgi:dsRNA-specific ribonuclease